MQNGCDISDSSVKFKFLMNPEIIKVYVYQYLNWSIVNYFCMSLQQNII